MANIYYVDPGNAVSYSEDPLSPPPPAPWILVTEDVYQDELFALWQASGYLGLKVTRSTIRANPVGLQDWTLDDGRGYAVFLDQNELASLGITQVQFDLDGSPHNTEFSAPWDFNGTDVGGEALKYVFTPGVHEIDAHITYGGGSVATITATFEVD